MVSSTAIARSLRDAICAGRHAPGTALRQVELAERFGTSRIPVREALQALQAEGLVVIAPHRGAYVAGMTADELDEVFDLRVLVETDALAHAVPHHDARSIRQLEALQRELDAESHGPPDVDEWLRRDRAFHDVLYAPCARARSFALIASLRTVVERFARMHASQRARPGRTTAFGPATRRVAWHDEHVALIAAVKAGRTARAVELLAGHLDATRQSALAALAGHDGESAR